MENQNEEPRIEYNVLKSHILLPVIFVISLAVAIMFLAVKDFTVDIKDWIVWFYVGISILYVVASIIDLIKGKERKKGLQAFIAVMIILNIIASTLFVTFFLIAKGR